MSWMVLVGCSSTATFTILWVFTTSWICTGPYAVLATLPVMVVSPAVSVPVVLWNSPGMVLEDDDVEEDVDDVDELLPVPVVAATGTVGACDLNDSRATRPAMVPVTARITRRMSRIVSLRTRTTRNGSGGTVLPRRAARRPRPRSCRRARTRRPPAR